MLLQLPLQLVLFASRSKGLLLPVGHRRRVVPVAEFPFAEVVPSNDGECFPPAVPQ